jgi:hypothetical protein
MLNFGKKIRALGEKKNHNPPFKLNGRSLHKNWKIYWSEQGFTGLGIENQCSSWRLNIHCRQRAPVENVPSASGTSQLGISKYYDHIVLLYLESRRCRYRSIIFVCFYLYVSVVNFIDYSDMDKMMDINNEKC